jgi:hypothetical protein
MPIAGSGPRRYRVLLQRPRGMPVLFPVPESSLTPLLIKMGSLSRPVPSGTENCPRYHIKLVVTSGNRQAVWRFCQLLLDFDVLELDGVLASRSRLEGSTARSSLGREADTISFV